MSKEGLKSSRDLLADAVRWCGHGFNLPISRHHRMRINAMRPMMGITSTAMMMVVVSIMIPMLVPPSSLMDMTIVLAIVRLVSVLSRANMTFNNRPRRNSL